MARLIDADALSIEIFATKCHLVGESDWQTGYRNALQSVLREIAEQPTVDAVEVVRCKDCAKAVRHEIFPHSRRCKVEDCRFSHKKTHFCSYGERRC